MDNCTCNILNRCRGNNPYRLCSQCAYYDNETCIRINMMCKLTWSHNYNVIWNKRYLLEELRNKMK